MNPALRVTRTVNVEDNTAPPPTQAAPAPASAEEDESFTLTLTAVGSGSGILTGGGFYGFGTKVTVAAAADTGSTFEGWTGTDAGECESGSVLMDSVKSCTGTFLLEPAVLAVDEESFTLTLTAAGDGSGTLTGGGSYVSGTLAAVAVAADTGSTFEGWTGTDAGECESGSVLMDSVKSCTGTFLLEPAVLAVDEESFTLTLTAAGDGSGTLTGGGSYVSGTLAAVVAAADTGSTFEGWTGTDAGECESGSVLMVSDKGCTGTFVTTVNVVDTTAPVITLLGSDPVSVEVGANYVDAGAVATDDLEGDLTGDMVTGGLPIDTSVLGVYTVTYDVTDSSGNAAVQVTRTVNVEDTTAPVITMLGSDPVSVEFGIPYADAGATALDAYDGDITEFIVTGGLPIDTSVIGTYTVTYDVTDSSGNAAVQVTRTVNVVDTTPAIPLTVPTPTPIATPPAATDDSGPAFSRLGGSLASVGIPGLTGAQIAGLIILLNMLLAALRLRQRSAERNWTD